MVSGRRDPNKNHKPQSNCKGNVFLILEGRKRCLHPQKLRAGGPHNDGLENIFWVVDKFFYLWVWYGYIVWWTLHPWCFSLGDWRGHHFCQLIRCLYSWLEHIMMFNHFIWFSMWYPDPTKVVGTGCRGRDQQAMRWFGKGGSFSKYGHFFGIYVWFPGGIFLLISSTFMNHVGWLLVVAPCAPHQDPRSVDGLV